MIHRIQDNEYGDVVQELDAEGIDYLIEGLEQLRDSEPGTKLSTPALVDEGPRIWWRLWRRTPPAVGELILIRADDVPSDTIS